MVIITQMVNVYRLLMIQFLILLFPEFFFSYQLINTSFAFITDLKTDFNSHSNIDFLKCLPETLPRGFIEFDTLKKLAKYFKFFPVIIGQFQNSMF